MLINISHLKTGKIAFRETDVTASASAMLLRRCWEADAFLGKINLCEYTHSTGVLWQVDYHLEPELELKHFVPQESLKLLLLLKGSLTLRPQSAINDWNLVYGQCAVFSSSEFTICLPGKTMVQYLLLEIEPVAAIHRWPAIREGCFDRSREMEAILQGMLRASERSMLAEDWLTLQLLGILLELRLTTEGTEDTEPDAHRHQAYAVAAEEYIRRNLAYKLTIKQISKGVGLNECSLKKAFAAKFNTGMIFRQNQMRIEFAKELLQFTQKSISDIARECGYINENTFRNNFQTATNETPGSWRQKHRL